MFRRQRPGLYSKRGETPAAHEKRTIAQGNVIPIIGFSQVSRETVWSCS